MVSFDAEKAVLHYQKIKTPDLHINIMSDVQDSYRNYLEHGIYEDVQYLQELVQELGPAFANFTVQCRVDNRVDQTYLKTQVSQANSYYPVVITLINPDGQPVGEDRELLRIPFLDDYGKLNVGGESKVILSCLRSAEDISYNLKNNTFNIAMPHANIRVVMTTTGKFKVKLGKQSFPLDELIVAMLGELKDNTKIRDIFSNTHILTTLTTRDGVRNWALYDTYVKDYTILQKYKSIQYKLGRTREALNETLQLDRALGETLSRDTLQYTAGTIITSSMINDFKKARLTVIYVRSLDIVSGYRYGDKLPMIIRGIPAGTLVGDYIRNRFPELARFQFIDKDYIFDQPIIVSHNNELSKEFLHFLVDIGYSSIPIHPGHTQSVVQLSFEKEIATNWTCRLRDVCDVVPEGRSADDWVYLYNNPNLEDRPMEYITVHDFIGIYSIMGNIAATGNTTLLNRDNAFLKKVMMIGDLFSESLRAVLKSLFQTNKTNLANKLPAMNETNPLASVTKKWISYMVKERFLSPVDSLNLISEVSQVNHINTLVANGAEVVDEQRHIAIPFYGRICPFETPAGKKLGLVNTKAMGGRVKDGILYAPYRKVIASKNGIRISDKITWLSAKDELKYKFSDTLLLKYDEDGNILNTPVLARIPNPDISDEPFIVATISSFELAGGFVEAFPEMSVSPTCTFIPFLGADDAIRISYAAAQIRQSVGLHNSKKPLLYTPMYEDVFDYSSHIEFKAPCSGTCTEISNIEARFVDLNGKEEVVYMQGYGHQGQRDQVVNLLISSGERVQEGQLIAEAYKYPQDFVVRAPFDGEIIDISDEGIFITKQDNTSGFIYLDELDMVRIENSRILGQTVTFMNIKVSIGDKVKKGDILADTSMSRDGIYTPSRNPLVAYVHTGYNYEDGVTATLRGAIDYTSVIAHKLDVEVSTRYSNSLKADGLKGFKYKAPGDEISHIKMYNSASDAKAARRKVVKATLKKNGIPYERGILKDDKYSRTYRYHLLAYNKLKVGDKMTGRHGNKGVVSKVFGDSKAYQLTNGRTVEFMLNPCGVPSRMNLGQIDDAKFGLCCTVLGVSICSPSYNGATHDEVMELVKYCYEVANAPGLTKDNRAPFDAVVSQYPQYGQAFHEHVWKNIEAVLDWTGVFNENGDAMLYNPRTGRYLYNPVTIGFPCYLKQIQEVDEKLNVRSGPLDEEYARTNSQPQKSDMSAKGQRMAEMELVAMAAYGCAEVINETLNAKSDNEGERLNMHFEAMGYSDIKVPQQYCQSRAVANLKYYLEAMGVALEMDGDDTPMTNARLARDSYAYDIKRVVNAQRSESGSAKQELQQLAMLRAFQDMED